MFAGGPQDVVATPDIYSINNNNVINSPVGRFSPFNGSSVVNNFVQGSAGFLSSITNSAISSIASGNSLTQTARLMEGRLQAAAGQVMGSLASGLQYSIAQNVNLALGEATGSVLGPVSNGFNDVEMYVGGNTTNLSVTDYSSTMQTVSIANQMAGSNIIGFNDVGASSAVLSTTLSSLITLGLIAGAAALIESTSTSMPTATHRALAANIRTAVSQSDLATIQLCITKLGIGGVLTQMPNAGLALMRGYRMPSGTTQDQYAALATTFLGVMNQLAPNWDSTSRAGTTITSLSYFAQASKDALTMLKTQSEYLVPCLIAASYPPQAMLTALRQEYPTAVTLR
jgi:hypothetical protein